jgi:DNA topoisomerase IB
MRAYWKTLSHNGVYFPDPFPPQGLAIRVRGRKVDLPPLAEEMALSFAKKKDTPYVNDPVFRSNFLSDFLKELPEWCRDASFDDIDFSALYRRVDAEKAEKESSTKEQKKALAAARKEKREALKAKYGKAVVDGKEVDIANWMVEPPGLFMGRGAHPLRGRWKPRVGPPDVILNLGESAQVPAGDWKEVVHDHNSMWMAKWIDKLTGKEKYVWLHESSPIQQSRSKAKYDNAQKVGNNLRKIRARIQEGLDSKDETRRQVATVCYLIDAFGMRVGDEKDEDEADTVGASTLRVEHVTLKGNLAEFKFLGKDSVDGESKLFYRVDGTLRYSTIKQMAETVPYRNVTNDSEGRLIGIPKGVVEVLTTDALNQKLARVGWGRVNAIISHEITGPIIEVVAAGGGRIRVSGDHSLFKQRSRGSCLAEAASVCLMTVDDSLATVSRLPVDQGDLDQVQSIPVTDDLLTSSGLWLAEGRRCPEGNVIWAGGGSGLDHFLGQSSGSTSQAAGDEVLGETLAPSGSGLRTDNRPGAALAVPAELNRKGTALSHGMNKGDAWLESRSKEIMQFLGLTGDPLTRRVPNWLFTASDRQIALFLKGYFGGRGFGSGTSTAVVASSVDSALLEEIRTLLLRLGIGCTIEPTSRAGFRGESPQWVLSIKRREDVQRYMRLVGFLGERGDEDIRLERARYKRYPIAWRKIRAIVPVASHGRVFDLEVEGTERFIVNGFLAHNSVAWHKSGELPPSVARNLRDFMAGKGPGEEIFHNVSSSMVNKFLSSVVPGVTAKVFRTYHATATAREALGSKDMRGADDLDKLYHAKEANLRAAVFCNHQRTPPKTWEESHQKKVLKLQEAIAKNDVKRIPKLKRELDFFERTKNYNLNTSMKNYIDPRVFKAWCDYVGLDWAKVYSKSLQKKFAWVQGSSAKWEGEPQKPLQASHRAGEHPP